MTNWNDIREAQADITSWANINFPLRTPQGTFVKLLEEIAEVAANPGHPLEYADLLILIFDLASMYRVDIPLALEQKMVINRKREWVFNTTTGLAHHIPPPIRMEKPK